MSLSQPILDLSNSASWTVVHETTLTTSSPAGLGYHSPIPSYTIPVTVDRHILAVGASSSQTKPTWRLAFWLNALVLLPGIGKAETTSHFVPLGLSLVHIPHYSSEYTLRVKIPKWYTSMNFKIWKYTGAESDVLDLLTEIHTAII